MRDLIEALKNYDPNTPDATQRLAAALEARDWRDYYTALHRERIEGHRRVCQQCLMRGDSLTGILRAIIAHHARIHAAGISALCVFWCASALPLARWSVARIIDRRGPAEQPERI
jgi:hypothetical protein